MPTILENNTDDISILYALKIIFDKKVPILLVTFFVTFLGFQYAKNIDDIYQSSTKLAPSEETNVNQSMGSLSGVAAIAGINIPSGTSGNNVLISLERLKSLDFFEMVVRKYDLYYELEAVKGWDKKSNALIIDSDVYDIKNKKWIYEGDFESDGKPSVQEAHSNFLKNFLINYDAKTGFVTLSMKHYSPHVAKKILDIFVEEINETVRQEDISSAEYIISYLNAEILKTKNVDLKFGISALIQAQIKKIAVANSSQQYILKTISPPFASERRFSPNRLLIVVIVFILTFISMSMYFLTWQLYRNESNSVKLK